MSIVLGEIHLALTTFALAVATPQFLKHKLLQRNTGGVLGLQINQPAALFHIPIRADAWLYWLTLLVTVILFALDSCYPLLSILFMAMEASGEIGHYGIMRFNGNTWELFGDLIGANWREELSSPTIQNLVEIMTIQLIRKGD